MAAEAHATTMDIRTSVEATANPLVGILELHILNATGVPVMDLSGKADPYVVINFGAKKLRTTTKKFTQAPVWDECFRILVRKDELSYDLEFVLWDWDLASADDRIGACLLSLPELIALGDTDKPHEFSLPYEQAHIGHRKKLMSRLSRQAKRDSVLNISARFLSREKLEKDFWDGIVAYFDSDGNQSIDQVEFMGLLAGMGSHVTDEQIDAMFATIDENGDGDITGAELRDFMTSRDNELTESLWPGNNELIWQVSLAMQDGHEVGELVMHDWRLLPVDELASKTKDDRKKLRQILVKSRETGKLEVEKIPAYIKVSIKLMYSNRVGRKATSGKKIKAVLRHMTHKQGRKYTSPHSVKDIRPFIAYHNLNEEEIRDDLSSFKNFNEFFYRKLKEECRPIAEPDDMSVAVSPADCRLNVFPSIDVATDIWVKGTKFSMETLLQDEDLAAKYAGGSMVIARLAPQDYHRYHSPVTGKLTTYKNIEGAYYTVNPIAINKNIDVYGTNKRLVTEIQTKEFGDVCFVAVGATMVGSICMTAEEHAEVGKGQELGYFAFGGSTVLVFYQTAMITFDDDLLVNSLKPIETLVKVGDRIGKAATPPSYE